MSGKKGNGVIKTAYTWPTIASSKAHNGIMLDGTHVLFETENDFAEWLKACQEMPTEGDYKFPDDFEKQGNVTYISYTRKGMRGSKTVTATKAVAKVTSSDENLKRVFDEIGQEKALRLAGLNDAQIKKIMADLVKPVTVLPEGQRKVTPTK